jgi:DNA (cytosine-5)-methyltransferase 1
MGNCLTTGMTFEHLLYSPETTRIRRLMPIECERLMGLPDNWTQYYMLENGNVREVSDTQRYRMCGNGIVPQVVMTILERLLT